MKTKNNLTKVATGLAFGAALASYEANAQDSGVTVASSTANGGVETYKRADGSIVARPQYDGSQVNPFDRLKPVKKDSLSEAFGRYIDYAESQAGTNAVDSVRLSYENGIKQVGKGLVGITTAGYGLKGEEKEFLIENDFKLRREHFYQGGWNLLEIPINAAGVVYNGLDVVTLGALPNRYFEEYSANEKNALTRTVMSLGNTVLSAERAGVNLSTGLSFGMADNFLYPASRTLEGAIATGKHLGQGTLQAVTLNRGPSWLTLAPLEFGENVLTEGFNNVDFTGWNYQDAFDEKGGAAILETMGSGALLGWHINNSFFSSEEVRTGTGGGSGTPGPGGSGGVTGGTSGSGATPVSGGTSGAGALP